LVEPQNEFRLIPMLREAASRKDPWKILARAAAVFYRAQHPIAGSSAQEDMELGNALADLAVTGRVAYKHFQQTPGFLRGAVDQGLHESMKQAPPPPPDTFALLFSLSQATSADFAGAVNPALDRAYAVSWALRGPVAQPAAARTPHAWLSARTAPGGLGWIAISGEDDKPHRPVNVAPPPFEQFEIPVTTQGRLGPVTTQVRFFIASAVEDPAPALIPVSTREPPPNPTPKIPDDHRVILFLHGDCSGAEEAVAIIPHIHAAGLVHGTKYSVVSIDLPNNGYSESFAHTRVAPSVDTSYPASGPIFTPILDYVEDFVVTFVDALDQITPVKNRFAGVIGGSLGGNLGLRLGRRPLGPNPWLNAAIVSWSAASVWLPILGMGPDHCRGNWDAPELPNSRHDHFLEVYDRPAINPLPGPTQPEMWYRGGDWLTCKTQHIEASRIARQEIYDANYRQWHWRLSGEQLVYSHIDRVVHGDSKSKPRYELNTVRQLLVAGAFDDYSWSNIYSSTQQLAEMMQTEGSSLFLLNTGHAIHVERPMFFAGEIVDFLPGPQRTDISFLTPLLLSQP
jgi:hypothetical protein